MMDIVTSFSQNMLWRLKTERIIWLTTISKSLVPQPRPVWFYWDGDSFMIYSKPKTKKLAHIRGLRSN
ncbi:MAG: pyridoxamine 5'-phosphate oxidase family protein [Candidatus Hermodarchaeia archaeon]|jgi:PPOX class probable F420-dependent enzyme